MKRHFVVILETDLTLKKILWQQSEILRERLPVYCTAKFIADRPPPYLDEVVGTLFCLQDEQREQYECPDYYCTEVSDTLFQALLGQLTSEDTGRCYSFNIVKMGPYEIRLNGTLLHVRLVKAN
jgi:hypothetical protein